MSKKKKIIIGSIVCLLPILLGSILWDLLPDNLVRYIGPGYYRFSSKGIVIFLDPFIFLLLHFIIVFKPDWLNTPKNEKRYWYMPIFSSAFFLISFTLSFVTN
ncbi:hypothetical protein [Senegalia massiliensis]|uniref:DUF1648 domain-containing protein n=1 Tax=Senegalia massiliensis TaxID=1720316 RepID=A0A845QZT3_9CLOT|nr:hypothetical protein [Senegalia massiliensis]NBI06692.1 hypothetical protein [Senegalia massiliensis]